MAAEGRIVVTGGSRGIGAAICAELARRGHQVVSLSRSGEAAAGTGMACDVTDEAAVRRCMAEVAGGGAIAGLVNNAGLHVTARSAELATAQFEQVMRINTTALMVASREAYPYLKQAGGGLIVNLGSFFDKLGVPHNLAYCASKAAVAAITRCLAVEWAKDGIRVVNVAPGYVATDLNADFLSRESVKAWMKARVPVDGRPGTAEEVARLVAVLYDERIDYLTGTTVYMDGGQGMNH